jgi:hypothetical protein
MSRNNGHNDHNGLDRPIEKDYDPDACPRCGAKMVHVGNRWICSRRGCRCIQEGFKGKEWKGKPVAIQRDMFGE